MHFRRSAAVLVTAAALVSTGCQTKVDDRGLSQSVAFAVFDPTNNLIPLPNDLALATVPDAAVMNGCALTTAQSQFLCLLKRSRGFPNDQEVPVTFRFVQSALGDGAAVTTSTAVALDVTTITSATVSLLDVTFAPTTVTAVAYDPAYVASTGTLTLRARAAGDGSRRWTAGHKYAVFVRGGASGVKTATGGTVEAMPTMFIVRDAIVGNRNLTDPDNQTVIPGTAAEKTAAGLKLEPLRQLYTPLKALYESKFGAGAFHQVANLMTFTIAPSTGSVVEVDAAKGSVPLPIDLVRLPDAAGGLIADNPAYASARAGMQTLDGFSTTGPLTIPVTGGVATLDVATIGTASGNVLVYDLSTTPPTQLKEFKQELMTGGVAAARQAAYVAQPTGTFVPAGSGLCPGTTGGCASTIHLDPAIPVTTYGAYLPPLKDGTKYAVVVTNRVKDILGRPLARSTAAKLILELTQPVDTSITDAGTAALLNQMRTDLAPVLANLPTGTTRNDVAMAYVFKTQSIVSTALKLSAAPYSIEAAAGAAVFQPQSVVTVTASYPAVTGAAEIYEVTFPSVDATSKITGALDPTALASPASHLVPLKALVAVPLATAVTANCPSGPLKCAPLVVWGHGLRGSKESLLVAAPLPASQPPVNALLAKGFVVAAVDFPQHGARTWCLGDAQCVGGGAGSCVKFTTPTGAPALQGDFDPNGVATAPGRCAAGTLANGTSGQTFVSSNFFRTRDMFRQNLLDQSALVLAVARPTAVVNGLTSRLAAAGIAVNPAEVYWEGISLGGIAGTEVLATNPRFKRGVTSVAGGTLVDVFTHSPSFAGPLNKLFTGLLRDQLVAAGETSFYPELVDPSNVNSFDSGVAAAYGKTLLLAKWILDPGDALNYARHVKTTPLPNLLANPNGSVPQSAKDVLGQVATGDSVIPNPFNLELFTNAGASTTTYTSNGVYSGADAMHGILGFNRTVQDDAAGFLQNLTVPATPASLP